MVHVTIDTHFYHSSQCKTRFQKQQTVVKGSIINSLLDVIAKELPMHDEDFGSEAKSRLKWLLMRPFLRKTE